MAAFPNGIGGVTRGKYRMAVISGLTSGLLANDTIASLRWAPVGVLADQAVRLALLQLKVTAQVVTAFTAAQEVAFALSVARGFTVADTGGTSFIPFTAVKSQQLTANVPEATLLNDFRISSGTALGAGTRILDDQPMAWGIGAQMLAAASAAFTPVVAEYKAEQQRPTPQILLANEGILLLNKVAMGAGGTVRFTVEVEWAEFNPNSG